MIRLTTEGGVVVMLVVTMYTTVAIQLNNKYVKAYQRRGKAREHFKLHKEQLYGEEIV